MDEIKHMASIVPNQKKKQRKKKAKLTKELESEVIFVSTRDTTFSETLVPEKEQNSIEMKETLKTKGKVSNPSIQFNFEETKRKQVDDLQISTEQKEDKSQFLFENHVKQEIKSNESNLERKEGSKLKLEDILADLSKFQMEKLILSLVDTKQGGNEDLKEILLSKIRPFLCPTSHFSPFVLYYSSMNQIPTKEEDEGNKESIENTSRDVLLAKEEEKIIETIHELKKVLQSVEAERIVHTPTIRLQSSFISSKVENCPNHIHSIAPFVESNSMTGICYHCAHIKAKELQDYQLISRFVKSPTICNMLDTGLEYYNWGKESSSIVAFAESTLEGSLHWLFPKVEPLLITAKPLLVKADHLACSVVDSKVGSFTLSALHSAASLIFTNKNPK